MDLDKLKSTWKNQPEETKKVSKVDIYKMAHSKSSSIVKWILIIGILELLFWSGLGLIIPDSFLDVYRDFNLTGLLFYHTSLCGSLIVFGIVLQKLYGSIYQ
jgi:nitrate reductase gamma subunit